MNFCERYQLKGLGVNGRIILKWNWEGVDRGLICLRRGKMRGSCEGGNKASASIKCEEFVG
jgi:hypothetical protein